MAKGEIVIKDTACCGCGYCQKFCAQGCIIIRGDKFTPQGYLLPDFANPDKCTACGICEWMCPHFAIEVYKYVENETAQSN
jgi:2-oxoglutarate ferredoxin oxidoreductase subunit delta